MTQYRASFAGTIKLRPDRRAAFTLVELIVTVAIAGMLVALLVPAIVSVRESSRKTECINHLHQIGTAAHSYEATWRVFPGTDRWCRQLLKHLEQTQDAAVDAVYACPSDQYATGDYNGLHISYRVNEGVWRADRNGYGGPTMRMQNGPRNLVDGLSTTVAYAEKLAWPDIAPTVVPPDMFQQHWPRRMRNLAGHYSDLDAFVEACESEPLPPGPGWHWISIYNHVATPNRNSCLNGPPTLFEATQYWSVAATSAHSGGVHALYADAHTAFVSDNIDRRVWRAVGTRDGHEVVAGR